ncbi:hypothetical protein [Streptomyces sp. RB13]|uniref:hypothetical protein n=1 Tax=Streptomyces sp. RB13 TaxID=2950978 RepID=UPI002FCAF0C0
MNEPGTETARALLYRHGLPEDVIDGALCLHAQELAAEIREETRRLKEHGVLEPWKYRPCRDAANQIDPSRSEDDVDPDEAAAPLPPADQTTLAPLFEGFARLLATSSRDWGQYAPDAWLYAVICGWDCEETTHNKSCVHGAMEEMAERHGWDDATVAKARRYRATVRAITEGAAVLPATTNHDTDTSAAPPPALTKEGRLRARVQVLEEDAERDQGLAATGARCLLKGHQGQIELGHAVIEGHRFALSTKLGLGTGAPWDAIHERVAELRRVADETAARSDVGAEFVQQVDQPDPAGLAAWERNLADETAATETDTLPSWLHWRFGPHGQPWAEVPDDDKLLWEHQARAVRRAVARGGFKQPAAGARQDGAQ